MGTLRIYGDSGTLLFFAAELPGGARGAVLGGHVGNSLPRPWDVKSGVSPIPRKSGMSLFDGDGLGGAGRAAAPSGREGGEPRAGRRIVVPVTADARVDRFGDLLLV
jgi:hypothetical protein